MVHGPCSTSPGRPCCCLALLSMLAPRFPFSPLLGDAARLSRPRDASCWLPSRPSAERATPLRMARFVGHSRGKLLKTFKIARILS